MAPDGNDDESTGPRGTFARPFKTIAKALQQSDLNQTANAAALTRIALRDGIYSGSSNRVENVALGTNGRGGALHLIGARGTMSSCEFVRNQCATTSSGSTTNSGSASGGAVYQRGRGNPVNNGTDSFWFRRCLFRENEAGKHGGATRNSGGRMFLYWCAFVRNTAGDAGGAHASSTGSATAIRETNLNHCTIFENYSRFAGALQVPPSTTTRLLNSLLHGNESRETPVVRVVAEITSAANVTGTVGTVVVSGTNHQAGAFASGITPAADSYSAVPRMAWDGIHLSSPTATNGQSLLGRTVVAHSLATNPIGMGATPPTDWDNELLTANASSSTVVPSESGCDDWRDSDSDQLPDWYETHIAALSARDGLNSPDHVTPSLVLWGSRWNLLQMLQLGADPGLPDASQADTDGDGLTDPRERQLLTQLYHWDSDGDGMADGWEDRYNLDPRSATGSNGAAADIDGDGLSNLDESRHGTNPNSADTDSDGRSDAQETQNGSDPDTFDQPVPPGLMRLVRFRFGDPSESLSEKYRLAVSGFDGRQFSSVNAGFNIVDGVDWQFRSGIRYAVSLHYLATKMSDGLMRPQPDYDCEVSIETDSTVSGLLQTNVTMGPGVNWRTAPNPSGEYFPITLRRNPANGLASLPPSTWIADNESHVLGQHWKPDFHNSKFEIQGKSAILKPIEFITPAGDPVSAPVDAGTTPASIPDGANEFTYNDAVPGVLTLKLKAKVPGVGSMPATQQVRFTFDVDAIGNSTFAWGAANPGGQATVSGDFITATATYTGLPQFNSDFGLKRARVKHRGNHAGEAEFEVFFPIDPSNPGRICNHPGGQMSVWNDVIRSILPGDAPNWYYYWKQLPEAQGFHIAYGGPLINGMVPAMVHWAYGRQIDKNLISIGSGAYATGRHYDAGESFSGIDFFGSTILHEGRHVWQITQCDALVPTGIAGTPWAHGWSFNQGLQHNHWTKGPDGQPGEPGVDDDGDGQVDNLLPAPPWELGQFNSATLSSNRDQYLGHPNMVMGRLGDWPAVLAYPNPKTHPHYEVESDAINYTDANYDEHRNARKDWGNPGKNHQTIDKWND